MSAIRSLARYGIGPRRGVCQWHRHEICGSKGARQGAQDREQTMPKIRHLAVICMDPEKLAQFYCDVFEMKVVARSTRNGQGNVFLTDGYMNLALLSQKCE